MLDKHKLLKDVKQVFVVVGPESSVCKRFELHDAPDPNTFLAMVSSFSPNLLEPKQDVEQQSEVA
ncbi:hypothetical protein GN244_ATG16305 [Phytophthora infestans]|uniref:Crinkler (CRN) family protein n=1 Tax=Phytophthora infestans TaxID=4787 RepID=A0A833WMJ1_PHYIN|nr:hypothetical protein GN244_ATG16305 [Phytophthora infestans]